MSNAQRVRTVIVTTPNNTDQDWMWRLQMVKELEVVDRLTDAESAVETIRQTLPELVMLDQPPHQAAETIRRTRKISPETICIAIVPAVDLDAMRQLMAAGARDVLARDVRTTELLSSLREIRQLEAERKQAAASTRPPQRGKLVVLVAPKGGVGTTTIATNLAIGLRGITSRSTLLVDLSLQFGDIGTQLNLPELRSIYDLAGAEVEASQVVTKHSSGLHVLGAPADMAIASQISGSQVRGVIDQLLLSYSYVVADTWSFLDEVTETLLSCADETLLIATPELPTLRNAQRFIDVARRRSLPPQPIKLVLNRYPSVDGISKDDIETSLGCAICASIPSDGSLLTYSINAGVPAIISHPNSWVAKNIMLLARLVAGGDTDTEHAGGAEKQPRPSEKGPRGLRYRMGLGI